MAGVSGERDELARLVREILDDPVWERMGKTHPERAIRRLRSRLEEEFPAPAPAAAPERRKGSGAGKGQVPEGFRLYTDGASSGNPGPSGAGGVIFDGSGVRVDEFSIPLGVTTNNVAEYTALREGLDRLLRLGARRAEILLDSELVVKQISGAYRVKSPQLAPLLRQVRERLAKIPVHTVRHVPRAENAEADKLARRGSKGPEGPAAAGEG